MMGTTDSEMGSYPIASTLSADVVVCGGGVAGTMAAVAAARQGASVILVERYGFLGGNATAGAVAQFNSWQTANGRTVVTVRASDMYRIVRSATVGDHVLTVDAPGPGLEAYAFTFG